MEIDVASIGTTEQSTTAATTSRPTVYRQEYHYLGRTSSELKRKKSDHYSSTALKSILRQRSDLASGSSAFSHKFRRKRAVKFSLEEKPEAHHSWSDKRLLYLALDLDRWDNLPHSALRTINKQKTRHTKRLKCCHSNEDVAPLHGKAARPEMDAGASFKYTPDESDNKIDFVNRSPTTPETVPEMESIEKSFFVSRWLQQSSRTMQQQPDSQHTAFPRNCSTPTISKAATNNPETTRLPTFSFSTPIPVKTSAFSAVGGSNVGVASCPVTPILRPSSSSAFGVVASVSPVTLRSPSTAGLIEPGATSSVQSLTESFNNALSFEPSSTCSWRQQ